MNERETPLQGASPIAPEPVPERLTLPPPYTAFRCDGAPFEAARARAGEVGAGGLFVAHVPGSLAFAVVLEPETALASARRAFPLVMAAAADALAAHCPPERAVGIAWPDVLNYDAARIGGGRLAWPEGTGEEAVPDWLVAGIELIADREALEEPGRFPETTSLAEEGFDAFGPIVESFARHLMLHLDIWASEGWERAAEAVLLRLPGFEPGRKRRIAENGDLVVSGPEGTQPVPLLTGMERWRDPRTGRVRL